MYCRVPVSTHGERSVRSLTSFNLRRSPSDLQSGVNAEEVSSTCSSFTLALSYVKDSKAEWLECDQRAFPALNSRRSWRRQGEAVSEIPGIRAPEPAPPIDQGLE